MPAAHWAHEVAEKEEYMPAEQLDAAVSPSIAQYMPAAQFAQLGRSGDAEKVPAIHAAHDTDPDIARLPVPEEATATKRLFP